MAANTLTKFPGIIAFSHQTGRSPQHIRAVLTGARKSAVLKAAWEKFQAARALPAA